MKKLILYMALLAGFLSACKKQESDPAPGQRPEERTEAALKAYQDALTGNKSGWIGYLYPDGGGGFSFYMTFSNSNRVTMISDIGFDIAADPQESSYKVRQALSPSLFFDTYNYMHILADPDASVNGGTTGRGLYSDFEFSIDTLSADTMLMHGNLNDSKLVMVKATAAQEAAFNAGQLKATLTELVDYTSTNQSLFIEDGNFKIATGINFNSKVFTITWVDDKGAVFTFSTPFATSLNGLVLKTPLSYNGKQITSLTWDKDKQVLYAVVDGQEVPLQVAAEPFIPLHLLIGIQYSKIIVPFASTYPGWSNDFVTRRGQAASAMLNGRFGLRMDIMEFSFNTGNGQLLLAVDIYQGNNRFEADFNYKYTKTADGTFTFTAATPTGNADLIADNMAPLTRQRLNVDHFTLGYFINPDTGEILGQFKDVEHPEFSFTGSLQ